MKGQIALNASGSVSQKFRRYPAPKMEAPMLANPCWRSGDFNYAATDNGLNSE
jgi:hypothetical protein